MVTTRTHWMWSRMVLVTFAMVAGLLAVGGVSPAAAVACDPGRPFPWTSESDMLNGCVRNFIANPGVGARLDPNKLTGSDGLLTPARVTYYVDQGFSRNFLWYAPRTTTNTGAADPRVWTACDPRHVDIPTGTTCGVDTPGSLTSGPMGPDFIGSGIPLHIIGDDTHFIALGCGNFAIDVGPPPDYTPKIRVTKFGDENRNGVQDPGEPRMSGVKFRAGRQSSLVAQGVVQFGPTYTTDVNGQITIPLDEHGPGRYYFEEIVPVGFDVTTLPLRHTVDVPFGAADDTYEVARFGNAHNEVDLEKIAFDIEDPQPDDLDVGVPVSITVVATVRNNGPARLVDARERLVVVPHEDCSADIDDDVLEVRRLALGESRDVTFDVTIRCDRPSDHDFTFRNELTVTTPGVTETNPSNNTAEFVHWAEVWADSDLAITMVDLACDPASSVDTDFTCSVTGTVENFGPYGPVAGTVDFVLDHDAAQECRKTPVGAESGVDVGMLEVGVPVDVSLDYTVNCAERSFHPFTTTISVDATNPHVIDEPESNNSLTSGEAVTEVFEDADLAVDDIALYCDEVVGDTTFTCTATVAVSNTGPAPDVQATVTAAISVSSDCTVAPSGTQMNGALLAVDVPESEIFVWTVTCSELMMLHPMRVTADVAPAEPHAVDVPGPVTDDWAVPYCMPTVNPNGRNEPAAPGNGGQGQNQDGFYQFGTKTLTEARDVWIEDTGTGTVFGPFASGVRIKYVEANGATPSIRPMGGNNGNGNSATAVDYQIKGQGDAAAVYYDEDGNVIRSLCLVPPRPQ